MGEVWKPVPGHPGFEASSEGRVRSLDRLVTQTNRWGSLMQRLEKGQMLAQRVDRYGYAKLGSKSLRETMAHRVVALAFHPNPAGKPQVNHLNGDRLDNRPENLEWCTNSENHIHAVRVLGRKPNVPPSKPVRLSCDADVKVFAGVKAAAEFLGVGKTAVMNAVRKGGNSKGWKVNYV